MKRRFVCLSDTHNRVSDVRVPEGDVILHSGDACLQGNVSEIAQFSFDLSRLKHKVKIFTPGNHDWLFQTDFNMAKEILNERAKVNLLLDSGLNLDLESMRVRAFGSGKGIKVYGSPWQPEFMNWAFNLPRGEPLRKKWDLIPPVDLLLTHGPPYGLGDYSNYSGQRLGDKDLLDAILSRIKPKVHLCGHIHPSHGSKKFEGTWFINAAIGYHVEHDPIVFDWDGKDDFDLVDIGYKRVKIDPDSWEAR